MDVNLTAGSTCRAKVTVPREGNPSDMVVLTYVLFASCVTSSTLNSPSHSSCCPLHIKVDPGTAHATGPLELGDVITPLLIEYSAPEGTPRAVIDPSTLFVMLTSLDAP